MFPCAKKKKVDYKDSMCMTLHSVVQCEKNMKCEKNTFLPQNRVYLENKGYILFTCPYPG